LDTFGVPFIKNNDLEVCMEVNPAANYDFFFALYHTNILNM